MSEEELTVIELSKLLGVSNLTFVLIGGGKGSLLLRGPSYCGWVTLLPKGDYKIIYQIYLLPYLQVKKVCQNHRLFFGKRVHPINK